MRDEIRDHSAEKMLFVRRAVIAFLLVVICFAILILNLYRLQVDQHDFYQTRSNQNDIKMLPIAPSRGLIFDRNGIPLVQNITLYRLFAGDPEQNRRYDGAAAATDADR